MNAGLLKLNDLAPRIKKLREEIELLEQRLEDLSESSRPLKMSRAQIRLAVQNLRATLDKGTPAQQKQTFYQLFRSIFPDSA